MTDRIRVVIVDDLETTRESVSKLLQFEPNVDLVGEATTGLEAIARAQELKPDIILMDINMPDMDGITASQKIVNLVPGTQIIMMSVQGEMDYIRRAMVAGARDFLTKPFSLDELITAVHSAYERRKALPTPAPAPAAPAATTGMRELHAIPSLTPVADGKTVAVFSPKGGAGCTTIAVNLAVSLAQQGHNTVLVDGSLQFGNVTVMLNLKPLATIIDLVQREQELDSELIGSVTVAHESGLKVLAGPPRPEMAEMVKVNHVEMLFPHLRQQFDYIVVDTSSKLDDIALAILDQADLVLLVTQQELPGITNASRFLDLARELEYPLDKVALVVNAVDENAGIRTRDVARALKRPASLIIPADRELATQSANQGRPVVLLQAKKRPIIPALHKMAQRVAAELSGEEGGLEEEAVEKKKSRSFLARLFGR